MANCAGIDCGQRQGLIQDATLWSTGLRHVLASNDGREELREFLLDCSLDDESDTLDFWERCNEIVCEHQKLKKTASSAGQYNTHGISMLISKSIFIIDNYVNSSIVNLDEQMKRKLNDCIKSKDPDKIAEVFQEAMGWGHNLLTDIHSLFAEELIRKYNLTKA